MGHAGGQVRRFSHRDGHVNGQNAATGQQRVCVVGGTKRRGGGLVPRMDGRHERKKQTTNKEQPATARTAPQNCTASYRSAPFKDGDTSGLCSLWRGVEGFEGLSRLLRLPAAPHQSESGRCGLVPSTNRYGWPFSDNTGKGKDIERFMVLVSRPSDRFTHPARRPKPPVAVAIAVAAMMLVWSDRGQWEKKDGRWAPVARPYHVR